jgi:hypothetical protein
MNCAATTVASTHQRREESTVGDAIWCMGELPDLNPLPWFDQIQVIPAITSGVSTGRQPSARYSLSTTISIRKAMRFAIASGIFSSKASMGRTSAAGISDQRWNPPLIG